MNEEFELAANLKKQILDLEQTLLSKEQLNVIINQNPELQTR